METKLPHQWWHRFFTRWVGSTRDLVPSHSRCVHRFACSMCRTKFEVVDKVDTYRNIRLLSKDFEEVLLGLDD
jgi:hypothetical protein